MQIIQYSQLRGRYENQSKRPKHNRNTKGVSLLGQLQRFTNSTSYGQMKEVLAGILAVIMAFILFWLLAAVPYVFF